MVTLVKYCDNSVIPCMPGIIGFNVRTGHTINTVMGADNGQFTEWYTQPNSNLMVPFSVLHGDIDTVYSLILHLLETCETEEEKEQREYRELETMRLPSNYFDDIADVEIEECKHGEGDLCINCA